MAYFSNGSEGMDWQSWNCDKCEHNKNDDCPLLSMSFLFNYDQLDEGQEKLKKAMDILMPQKDCRNEQCGMFMKGQNHENDNNCHH